MPLELEATLNSRVLLERFFKFFDDKPLLLWRLQVGAILLCCLWGYAHHTSDDDDPLPGLYVGMTVIAAYLFPTVILWSRIEAANSGRRPLPADSLAQIALFALQMAASGFAGTALMLLTPKVPTLQFLWEDPFASLSLCWMPALCAIPLGCLTRSHRFGKWAMILSISWLVVTILAIWH